jgi:hypothetical protein
MKPKVFISSTYLDLIPYREKLWQALSNMGFEIFGMEKFGARSSAPIDTCLQEVTKSDVYIGIISFRYGSIHKESRKSFTELEYERAVSLNKEILIYLFDSEGLIKPKFVDIGNNGLKLKRFKGLLQKRHTTDTFTDPLDLASKVSNKLIKLLPSLKKKRFVRPRALASKLYRFKIGDDKWIAFVGYLDNVPFEVYTVKDEDPSDFPIPHLIKNGKIEIIDSNGRKYFAFTYIDKFGYKNTIGGINHPFNKQMAQYNIIITTLLQRYTPISTIFDTIDNMNITSLKNSDEWKKGIKNALQKE